MTSRSARRARLPFVAVVAAVVLVASVLTLDDAGATPSPAPAAGYRFNHPDLRNSIGHGLPRILTDPVTHLPVGVPSHGNYAFLLRLKTTSTVATYRQFVSRGKSTAAAQAETQYGRIRAAQAEVVAALPADTHVLYKTHNVLAGVAVLTNVRNYHSLQQISGVAAVYPIAPKTVANSYAVPLVHAPQVWATHGFDLGQFSTIAIIDTGVDYTHADLGGPGTAAAYTTAKATDDTQDAVSYPDPNKIAGGFDFAGDTYDPDQFQPDGSPNPDYQPTPDPNPNPLDCNGHGSHVAGTAAGYGENTDGTTFAGKTTPADYTTLHNLSSSAYQAMFRIGPGMAPLAKIYAYKVFGCSGSTDLIGAAIDRAMDPNNDGNPADHVSVINMSLGSDYGSPQDGDSVESNLASAAGVSVVVASGNGGDNFDVGGSPGNAVRAISVANSVDAYNQIDSLHVTFNGSTQPAMGAERSVLYNYGANPDLSGNVVQLTQTNNTDACDPVTQDVTGKVVFVEWTDNDSVRRCGSKTRADNLSAAGATGFIFADDAETFSAGINGNASIPGVLVIKSAGDALRTALTTPADQPVSVTGTTAGDYSQIVPGDNDKVNPSSSRGIGAAGDVKPDVTAIGTSVFSTAVGTGDAGVSESGTSMATPMVAGLAALVREAHPGWTPEQVKADIMNTAGQDLFTGAGYTGTRYAPNRVGAGRIQSDNAVDNTVLAYVNDNPGAVSVSFGPVAISGATTLTKTVNVVNTNGATADYSLSYEARTSVPGVTYTVSPSTLSVPAGSPKQFTVKLVVTDPTALTKTHDPTLSLSPGGTPREFLADASGLVVLTPTSGATIPLRVPVYSAPRPASTMTQPSSVALTGGNVQTGSLPLSGHGLNQGTGSRKIRSFVSGFELQATSGLAPTCAAPTDINCVHFADERSADLKYVGFTSDARRVKQLGGNPYTQGQAYFAITTQGAWRSPVGFQEFDVLIDTNGDNVPDAVVYNTRVGSGDDIFLSELVDLTDPNNPFVRDDELINDRFGSTDTALFDSNTMVLPLWVNGLGQFTIPNGGPTIPAEPGYSPTHTRISYGVVAFGPEGPVDAMGVNMSTGNLNNHHMSADTKFPGIEVDNPSILNPPTVGLLLNSDQPGASNALEVRRDVTAYNADHGQGALLVHFQNANAQKAQLVAVRAKSKVTLTISPLTVHVNHSLTATISVANTSGRVPTGQVTLHRASAAAIVTGTLTNGKFTFVGKPGVTGTFKFYATYTGDANYTGGRSATVTVTVVS